MKKLLSIFALMSLLYSLTIACNSSGDKAASESTLTMHKEVNCLEKFHGNPEELLSVELVGKFIDFNGAEAAVDPIPDALKSQKDYVTANCKWYIKKKRHIVRLQMIKKIKLYDKPAVDQFYFQYHTRSEEEQAELKKALDKEVEKETKDKNASKVTSAIGMDFQYIKVDGIGDAAVWEHKVNSLIVLVGEYQFTVNVQINQGNDVDLEKAKLIANAIIEKACAN